MRKTIKLNRYQILTVNNIVTLLNSAKGTYEYAKFILHNGIYITVHFNRDLTIELSTNSRDMELFYKMQTLRRQHSVQLLADFVFNQINRLNR